METAALLLEAGADPNLGDHSGLRPVHVAAYNGRVDLLTLLLRHGGDPALVVRGE
jgi:ankyrin repeat protein